MDLGYCGSLASYPVWAGRAWEDGIGAEGVQAGSISDTAASLGMEDRRAVSMHTQVQTGLESLGKELRHPPADDRPLPRLLARLRSP